MGQNAKLSWQERAANRAALHTRREDLLPVHIEKVTGSIPSIPTIQCSQTGHFVGCSKEAVSVGISPVSSPDFPSLWTSAVSRADSPVSASKNSVPGSWISRGNATGQATFDRCSDEIRSGTRAKSSYRPDAYCIFGVPRSARRQSPSPTRSRQASDSLGQSH
jgi:hypothetical protein